MTGRLLCHYRRCACTHGQRLYI